MVIILNHNPSNIPEHYSVQELLYSLFSSEQKGIAVAINEAIVPRSAWRSHMLRPNDSITLIRASQGG